MLKALVLTLLLVCGSSLAAQETPLADAPAPVGVLDNGALDYSAWDRVARRAEEVVDTGRAGDAALEQLRLQIADWRRDFQAAQTLNKERIATLQAQLAVLGEAPQDGGESPEIAARRSALTRELTRLQAPVLAAGEAYSRANGIIGEIDGIIRDRQADALISLGPSPLNPAHWTEAAAEIGKAVNGLRLEFQANLSNDIRQFEFREQLLVILPLLTVGFVLLLRGRRWVGRLSLALRRMERRGAEFWSFLVSLGKFVVPTLGLLLVVLAVLQTGFVGLKLEMLLVALPFWGAVLLFVLWMLDRLFPDGAVRAPFDLAPAQRARARRLGLLLVSAALLADIVNHGTSVTGLSVATRAVIGFPVLLLTALVLLRCAQFVLARIREGDNDAGLPFRLNVVRILARAASVVAFIGPALAAIGYANAAEALLYPTVMTCGLLAAIFVVLGFVDDAYALVSRADAGSGDALLPTLIGFVLVLMSLPFLALIWGARVADLTELWGRFLTGINIGETRISPTNFLTFALLFAIGYVTTRMLQAALRSSVLPKTRIDSGGQTAIVSGIGYVGIFLAAVVAITGAGIDLSSIAIVAGALSVGIGFGLQTVVSNFVSGIILLIERPISEGDWIEVGGQMGYVRDISVRATRIETFDRTDVIVPNADLVSGTVTNYTRGNTVGRVILKVGVAYGSDTRQVEAILRELTEAHPMVLANPAPSVLLQGFGADSLDFEIRAILRDINWSLTVRSDLNHEIARRFAEEGIEIPFAQRDIWLRNPEALQAPPQPAVPQDPALDPTDPDPELRADKGDPK